MTTTFTLRETLQSAIDALQLLSSGSSVVNEPGRFVRDGSRPSLNLLPKKADGWLQVRFESERSGGADRVRTGDPLVANQVLSQLSYSPVGNRQNENGGPKWI